MIQTELQLKNLTKTKLELIKNWTNNYTEPENKVYTLKSELKLKT